LSRCGQPHRIDTIAVVRYGSDGISRLPPQPIFETAPPMTDRNRRKFERHRIDIGAKAFTPDGNVTVTATELSVGGLRLLSPKPFRPGTQIFVRLELRQETLLHGTVVWVMEDMVRSLTMYQTGVQIYAIVVPEIKAIGFPEQAELVREIRDRIKAESS
jgi:hypothetical protein